MLSPTLKAEADFPPEARAKLTPRQRQVVEARIAGIDIEETAASLGLTAGTVRMNMRNARRRLGLPDGRAGVSKPRRSSTFPEFEAEHLALLPLPLRRVVAIALERVTAPVIAARLNTSLATVRNRIWRARALVKAAERTPPEPPPARCKCGLTLPCYNCVTAEAHMRSGASNLSRGKW